MSKDTIKVLYIAHDANLYGSNQSLFYLVKELRDKYDVRPTILVPKEGSFTQKLKNEDIEFLVVKYCLWQAVYKTKLRFALKSIIRRGCNFIAEARVKRVIKKKEFDLVHSNSSVVKMGSICASWLNIPHIWHIREFGQEDWGMRYMYTAAYVYEKYRNADILITVSKGIEEKYRKQYPKCNIKTIYNGIPVDKFEKKNKLINEEVNFCQVGYISETKNQLQVLEACKLLKEKYKVRFKMHFVGSGEGGYYQEFLNYIAENQLSDYVKMWGFQKNIEDVLPQMDVGIISSRMEGFGRVTIEFMMSGIPVIGYASGGTVELIDDRKDGLLYDSVNGLIENMLFLIRNKEEILKMGEAAYRKASTNFTVEKNADLIFKSYKEVMS